MIEGITIQYNIYNSINADPLKDGSEAKIYF